MKTKILVTLWVWLSISPILFSQSVKIATFNCEFLVKKKVHIKYGLPFYLTNQTDSIKAFWANESNRSQKFIEASQAIAEHLVQLNADVLGLTEVGGSEDVTVLVEQLKQLGLDYPHVSVGKSTDTRTGQHVAILSKFKLRDIVPSFDDRGLYFTEGDKDEVKETGISKGMQASIKVNGQEIHLFLLHLVSERGSHESDQQRVKQAELIRNRCLPYLKEKGNILIMGDFNSERGHEVLMTLRGFNDIYQELIQTGDNDYFKNFDMRWTYEFQGNKEQIDHILLSIPLRKLCFSNTTTRFGVESTIIETSRPFISDHHAFVVDLNFR